MSIPVYDGDRLIVPVTCEVKSGSYNVPVQVIEPVAIISIKSNGVNLIVLSRWQLFKLLVLSLF